MIDQEEMLEGHILIGVEILSQNITSQLLCGFCHSEVSLIEVQRQGLASELAFHCRNGRCKGGQSFPSCQKTEAGNLQISSMNRRAALAMRSIGCDHADLRTFCGIMNLPPASKSTHQHIKKMRNATTQVMNGSMAKAARQEYEMADPIDDDVCRILMLVVMIPE